jgi:DNA-binding transcriptional LysR family regulator
MNETERGIFDGLSYERMWALVRLQECDSLFEAADRDPGTQSRFSHHLKDLSAHFGVKLTERDGRKLRLTQHGKLLASLAREHFKSLEIFKTAASQMAESWCIGSDPGILGQLVVPALARTRQKNRPRTFRLVSQQPEPLTQQLVEGRVDFGIMRRTSLIPSLIAIDVFEFNYIVAIPTRLLPAGRVPNIAMVLGDFPHAFTSNDSVLATSIAKIGKQNGVLFRPEIECGSVSECVAAVKSGQYAAILPTHAVEHDSGDWIVFEHESLQLLNERVSLAWSAHTLTLHGRQGKTLKDELINAIKEEASSLGIGID